MKIPNDISGITTQRLDEMREHIFFDYNKRWYAHKNATTRFIKTSRLIGTTFYFAFEALDDAIRTGENQIFITMPDGMTEAIKDYIVRFANDYLGVTLKGDNALILSNNAYISFLSEDNLLLNGEILGNVYLDQCFFLDNFIETWKVAKCFSAHKKHRRTLYGTHPLIRCAADALWDGSEYNENRHELDRCVFDLSQDALQKGVLGNDGIWRNAVTVEDAVLDGFDLFDIDSLQHMYTKEQFNNFFMCDFSA